MTAVMTRADKIKVGDKINGNSTSYKGVVTSHRIETSRNRVWIKTQDGNPEYELHTPCDREYLVEVAVKEPEFDVLSVFAHEIRVGDVIQKKLGDTLNGTVLEVKPEGEKVWFKTSIGNPDRLLYCSRGNKFTIHRTKEKALFKYHTSQPGKDVKVGSYVSNRGIVTTVTDSRIGFRPATEDELAKLRRDPNWASFNAGYLDEGAWNNSLWYDVFEPVGNDRDDLLLQALESTVGTCASAEQVRNFTIRLLNETETETDTDEVKAKIVSISRELATADQKSELDDILVREGFLVKPKRKEYLIVMTVEEGDGDYLDYVTEFRKKASDRGLASSFMHVSTHEEGSKVHVVVNDGANLDYTHKAITDSYKY